MATNSFLGSFLRMKAAAKERDLRRKYEGMNYNSSVKEWEGMDWFPKAFGGGYQGLTSAIGRRAQDTYNAFPTVVGNLEDRYGQFSTATDEFRPDIERAEELGKQLLSGEYGAETEASYKPVYEARTKAVATNREAQLGAINETLNRINSKMRAGGFSGASSANDKIGAELRRKVYSDVAGQAGAVDVANTSDQVNIANQVRNERLRAALGGLPQQLASGRMDFESAPMLKALAAILGPEQEFNATVAPYKNLNTKPQRRWGYLPSKDMLWKEHGAQVADTVADLAMSYVGMAGGGGGGGGGMGGIMGMLGKSGGTGGGASPAASGGGYRFNTNPGAGGGYDQSFWEGSM